MLQSANGTTGAYEFSEASVPGTQSKNIYDNAGGPVASGQAVAGSIAGQLDAYSFSAQAGGTIEASVGTPTTLELEMDLFDPSGLRLNTAQGTGTITLTATSTTTDTYYIVLKSANGHTGAYEFSEASVPGTQSKNIYDNAGGPVASGQAVAGSIARQLDAYSFSARAGGTIEASVGTPTTMELEMDLYDPTGTRLGTAKGTGTITLTAPSTTTNTYYIVLESANGHTGDYEFSEASVPGTQSKNTIDGAGGPVASGQQVDGNIAGQLDAYSFSATAGGTIEASVETPTTMEMEMDLFDPSGLRLSTEKGTGTISLTALSATTNTYYIVIESANEVGGSYRFSLSTSAGPLLTLANLSNNIYLGSAGYGPYTSLEYDTDPSNAGYAAGAYIIPDGTQIIIAFRGTVLSSGVEFIKDLAWDVSICRLDCHSFPCIGSH